jgi:hypothetical protein
MPDTIYSQSELDTRMLEAVAGARLDEAKLIVEAIKAMGLILQCGCKNTSRN